MEPVLPLPVLLPALVAKLAAITADVDPSQGDTAELENKSQKRALLEKSLVALQRFNDFPRGDADVFEKPALGWCNLPAPRLVASGSFCPLSRFLQRARLTTSCGKRNTSWPTASSPFARATCKPQCPTAPLRIYSSYARGLPRARCCTTKLCGLRSLSKRLSPSALCKAHRPACANR